LFPSRTQNGHDESSFLRCSVNVNVSAIDLSILSSKGHPETTILQGTTGPVQDVRPAIQPGRSAMLSKNPYRG
jgi:hypothetical protein